jgi:hypothetical protein
MIQYLAFVPMAIFITSLVAGVFVRRRLRRRAYDRRAAAL